MSLLPSSERRIAFYGGSFDPPHLGHIAVARAAQSALALDTVLFAPVGTQPLKPGGPIATFADRVAMIKLAIQGEANFSVSLADAPKTSGKPNYTFETLEAIKTELPQNSALFCLIGADSFFTLQQWHRADEIPFLAPLIVAARPGQNLDEIASALPDGITLELPQDAFANTEILLRCELHKPGGERAPLYLLPDLRNTISASEIRKRIHGSDPVVKQMIPEAVMEYIEKHYLYCQK